MDGAFLFPRKAGSLAIETPRPPGRSAVCFAAELTAVLARNQADRVSASPEAEQSGQAKKARRHSCSHTAASSLGDFCVTNLRTGTSGSSATSSSASAATMPPRMQGRGLPWW